LSNDITILMFVAASIGFFHTLFGPDHYLPFIVMARANRWSTIKTIWITLLCGVGHVVSSVALGIIGIAMGIGVTELVGFESFRGNIATWLLIGFGLVYFIWGVRNAIKNKPHEHFHAHEDEKNHTHRHIHSDNHAHVHSQEKKNFTPWILFTIFILGPCESLIPILMYPAAKSSIGGVILVTSVFGIVTIATMLGVVLISLLGINFLPTKTLERYIHPIAGATIIMSGIGIHFLNL
jgi:nickel/cobalt exporter